MEHSPRINQPMSGLTVQQLVNVCKCLKSRSKREIQSSTESQSAAELVERAELATSTCSAANTALLSSKWKQPKHFCTFWAKMKYDISCRKQRRTLTCIGIAQVHHGLASQSPAFLRPATASFLAKALRVKALQSEALRVQALQAEAVQVRAL